MKLALVYPSAAWSTRDVAAGYARAFESLGHEVLRLDFWQAACRAAGGLDPRFYQRALEPQSRLTALKEILAGLRSSRASWALIVHGADLPRDLPEDLRSRGMRSALLLTDEPYELQRSLAYAKGYDLVLTNDPATLGPHRTAHPHAEYLPPGFDPEVMHPDPQAPVSYDVAFVGTWFRERVAFFETLWEEIEHRPHLLAGYWFKPGDRLPQGDLPPGGSPLAARVKPVIVLPTELCKVYQRTKVSINLHRGSLWHANPEGVRALGVNPRLFEIAGAGGFQLVDARAEVRRCFAEDEVALFSSLEEGRRMLREWLEPSREAERKEMASRALKRALSEHTYAHRAKTLLGWIS